MIDERRKYFLECTQSDKRDELHKDSLVYSDKPDYLNFKQKQIINPERLLKALEYY